MKQERRLAESLRHSLELASIIPSRFLLQQPPVLRTTHAPIIFVLHTNCKVSHHLAMLHLETTLQLMHTSHRW